VPERAAQERAQRPQVEQPAAREAVAAEQPAPQLQEEEARSPSGETQASLLPPSPGQVRPFQRSRSRSIVLRQKAHLSRQIRACRKEFLTSPWMTTIPLIECLVPDTKTTSPLLDSKGQAA
jgi:hypothetical protein